MAGTPSWIEPTVDWQPTLDVDQRWANLRERGELIVRWPATEFDTTDTDCFTTGSDLWIWQPEVGAVRFRLDRPHITAWPWPGSDSSWFQQIVTRSWLPAIYPLWGRQVLHASAVQCIATEACVAFTGSTHAGKSTTAYGMQRRAGWRPIADDTVAFSAEGTAIRLHPIPNAARLRPASAEFFAVDRPAPRVPWPGGAPFLAAAYVLDGNPDYDPSAEFTRLRPSEALPLLLQQAYALSFEIPKYNQQLMKDYLALAAAVPMFRLRYRRSFDVAEELFSAIQGHLASVAGVACPAGSPDSSNV